MAAATPAPQNDEGSSTGTLGTHHRPGCGPSCASTPGGPDGQYEAERHQAYLDGLIGSSLSVDFANLMNTRGSHHEGGSGDSREDHFPAKQYQQFHVNKYLTAPYYIGPQPWAYRRTATEPHRLMPAPIGIEDLVLLEDIIDMDPDKKAGRLLKFGPWNIGEHIVDTDTTNNEEHQFLRPKPEGWVFGCKPEGWLQSEAGERIYDHTLRDLLNHAECDIHLFGGRNFIDSAAKTHLLQRRMERALYEYSQDIREAIQSEKRFWAFFCDNNSDEQDYDAVLDPDGAEAAVPGKISAHTLKIVFEPTSEWKIEKSSEELDSMAYAWTRPTDQIWKDPKDDETHIWDKLVELGLDPDKDCYYRMEEEEEYLKNAGVKDYRRYYRLGSLADQEVMYYRAFVLNLGGKITRVLVAPKNKTADGVITPVIHGLPRQSSGNILAVRGNHYWLAIFDTKTGELFHHDSLRKPSSEKQNKNLLNNLHLLNQYYALRWPTALHRKPQFADCFKQGEEGDCGFITLHNLHQFLLGQIALGKTPSEFGNLALRKLTPSDWDAGIYRLKINNIVKTYRGKTITKSGTLIRPDKGLETVLQKSYFEIKDIVTMEEMQPYEHKDYSILARKFQRVFPFAQLMTRVDGHAEQLDLIRYHLDHAGAVVFSAQMKNCGAITSDMCEGKECKHYIDVVPVPRNCTVILNILTTDEVLKDEKQAAINKRKSISQMQGGRVMIGHCSTGVYSFSNPARPNLEMEFNGYSLNLKQFRCLKLPRVGYFSIGGKIWGFLSMDLSTWTPSAEVLSKTSTINNISPWYDDYMIEHGTDIFLKGWNIFRGTRRSQRTLQESNWDTTHQPQQALTDSDVHTAPHLLRHAFFRAGRSQGAPHPFSWSINLKLDELKEARKRCIENNRARQSRFRTLWKKQNQLAEEYVSDYYASDGSIDAELDKPHVSGIRPRRARRTYSDHTGSKVTKWELYEYSSADDLSDGGVDPSGHKRIARRHKRARRLNPKAVFTINANVVGMVRPDNMLRVEEGVFEEVMAEGVVKEGAEKAVREGMTEGEDIEGMAMTPGVVPGAFAGTGAKAAGGVAVANEGEKAKKKGKNAIEPAERAEEEEEKEAGNKGRDVSKPAEKVAKKAAEGGKEKNKGKNVNKPAERAAKGGEAKNKGKNVSKAAERAAEADASEKDLAVEQDDIGDQEETASEEEESKQEEAQEDEDEIDDQTLFLQTTRGLDKVGKVIHDPRVICIPCGKQINVLGYKRAYAKHGPGTACNVVNWGEGLMSKKEKAAGGRKRTGHGTTPGQRGGKKRRVT